MAGDPSVKKSILKEIALTLGSVVEAPSRFVAQERGLLALSIGSDLILSQTAQQESAVSPAITVTGKDEAGASAQPKEVSILEEIISSLGSSLTNQEKLIVPPFPKAMREEMEAAQLSVASTPSDSEDPTKEPSILEEIVSSLGGSLTNQEKLIVPPFPKAILEEMEGASIMPPESAAEAPSVPPFEPVELSFGQYQDAMKKVRIFQQNRDSSGYRDWLTSKATPAMRLLLSLQKSETRHRRGEAVQWDDVYYESAQVEGLTAEQARELHKRMGKYARMQQLQSQFISKVKQQPPVVLQAFQKLWPQIQLILADEGTAESRMKQLKFPLLQITNPKLKAAMTRMLEPLFQKMDEIRNS